MECLKKVEYIKKGENRKYCEMLIHVMSSTMEMKGKIESD